MPSKLKTYMLDELRLRFENVEHCVVVNFSGVTATEMTQLRTEIRKEDGSLMVVKNSIATRAFRDLGCDDEFVGLFDGPVALAFGEDPAPIVRAIADWDKKSKKLTFKGGIVGGKGVQQADIAELATLPPMPVMQAIALGAVAAPLSSFLRACKEVIQSFVRIADQLAQKESGADEALGGGPAE
ncbi:MAG: 50S ribosomal protein L10 [Planctomycetes bacterium]|nr:50S ribosomal protein L10 [Planctomycetota bacterium]